tara:strand:+ start:93 stop:920 length:828 start_codon:yes stop_codon:yes gene_type:complete
MTQTELGMPSPWDFRSQEEILLSSTYEKKGYVIEGANTKYLESMRKVIENAFVNYLDLKGKNYTYTLENAHVAIGNEESNDLRLFIMQKAFSSIEFLKLYYKTSMKTIHNLCGNELAMQKRPGLSINLPNNYNDILPIHADTWNGVSPYELNMWIPLVDCNHTMCLYILEREKYLRRVSVSKDLLKLDSDDLFKELRNDLTWIEIKYGQILAFDQSLPHGFSLNEETKTHWSLNCRFKGLHTPYWDKKLGEYFMPITVKNCTRLGMNYKHPENWI